jgi:very-short-patch-repair endonuclease
MARETGLGHNMGAELRSHEVDRAIGSLADVQHGVVARRQLLEMGVSRRVIGHRLRCGRLHLVHRGVFAVGLRRLTSKGRWMAAVLAVGSGGRLSERGAAAAWGLRPQNAGPTDVAVPRKVNPISGLRIHHIHLPPDEVTTLDGIPITTHARTLFDLAKVLPPHQLERAIAEAEYLRLHGPLSLDDLVDRHAGERGATRTRSELEARFLAFLDARALPRPGTNVIVHGFEVDCFWPDDNLVVELDGHASHTTTATFERDRLRDRALSVLGIRTVRVTWRHLHLGANALENDLRTLMTR